MLSRAPRNGSALVWPGVGEASIAAMIARRMDAEPWLVEAPLFLPAGRILFDASGEPWWQNRAGEDILPVDAIAEGPARAADLDCAAAIWSARGLRLLAAQTAWGRIDCVS